ncbi:MAG: HAD hydrolase family protein, partial [Eubacteriaceae bacterium]|nr:HAD hydrolase family protein [Eubacteriaceae bacterium]
MKTRLVVLDLDDTLLTTDKKILQEDRQAIIACLRKGINVVTASGRFHQSQLDFIQKMACGIEQRPQVGDGGGTIFLGETVLKKMGFFNREQFLSVLKQVKASHIPCYVSDGEHVYYDIKEQPLHQVYQQIRKQQADLFCYIPDLSKISNPLRFICAFHSQEEEKKLKSINSMETVAYRAGRNLIEITTKSLNKLNGVKEVLKWYRVNLSQVACIG